MSKTHDILIIGAGIGGLSAAIHLATAGQRVKILEKNAQVGGKMGEITADGFRWDTGPSVITMRHVFESLFTAAGRRLEDYLTLIRVDPLTRYFYPDGTILNIHPDINKTLAEIQKIAPEDVKGFQQFLAYAARLHRITGPVFIYDQPPTWRSFFKVSPLDALRVDGQRTMQKAIEGFVKSPHLRQLLGRFATYVGASPYLAPATLNVIADVELTGGVWYPAGGIYTIARALKTLAEALGVEICENTPVEKIVVREGKTQGVILATGDFLPAQAVIANVDVSTVYENLLPPEAANSRRIRRLFNRESSCSGFVMLLGVKGTSPQLAHHNIFFSEAYPREFEEIFRLNIPPSAPTVYVSITSKTDPQDAPSGHENWFVLVNVPPLGSRWHYPDYREIVLKQLAAFGIQPMSIAEKILTPADLEQMTGARHGALYGASSNNRWAAFVRPHNRAPDIRGLYFAGGTTHPGGGVPMVTLSGRVAAKLCLDDLT